VLQEQLSYEAAINMDLQNMRKGKILLSPTRTVEAWFDSLEVFSEDLGFLDAEMVLQLTPEYFYDQVHQNLDLRRQ
jgi:hypothetical protein